MLRSLVAASIWHTRRDGSASAARLPYHSSQGAAFRARVGSSCVSAADAEVARGIARRQVHVVEAMVHDNRRLDARELWAAARRSRADRVRARARAPPHTPTGTPIASPPVTPHRTPRRRGRACVSRADECDAESARRPFASGATSLTFSPRCRGHLASASARSPPLLIARSRGRRPATRPPRHRRPATDRCRGKVGGGMVDIAEPRRQWNDKKRSAAAAWRPPPSLAQRACCVERMRRSLASLYDRYVLGDVSVERDGGHLAST